MSDEVLTDCPEPHPLDWRCFDCATDEELAASIGPPPDSSAAIPERQEKHLAPMRGDGLLSCCGQTIYDVQPDSITIIPDEVTCTATCENRAELGDCQP